MFDLSHWEAVGLSLRRPSMETFHEDTAFDVCVSSEMARLHEK